MSEKDIEVELARHSERIQANEFRLDALEGKQEKMDELVRSVDKLATSMAIMVKEQERQGKQIDTLESSKVETFRYWLRTILAAAATGLVGYALASLIK